MSNQVFYTAGYQSRRPADLLARAGSLGADVVDIRLSACSRQPGWSKPELQAVFGPRYQHVPALGNANYKSRNEEKNRNDEPGGGIQLANVELGLKILLSPRRLEAGRPAILLCGCREPEGCHRSMVGELLQGRGFQVEELTWEVEAEQKSAVVLELPSPASDTSSVGVPAPIVASVLPLPTLNAPRAELARLHGHIVRLRCEEPLNGTRANALEYQLRRIDALAEDSVAAGGTEDGWPDPEDDLADCDQIQGLRLELAELTAAGDVYPLALPEGCCLLPVPNFDLLAHGRLGNGKLSQWGIAGGVQL